MSTGPKGISNKEYLEYLDKCRKFDEELRNSQEPKLITEENFPGVLILIGILVIMIIGKIIKG